MIYTIMIVRLRLPTRLEDEPRAGEDSAQLLE